MGYLPPHLFVDISSHGFGHLSQTAPVLNELAELLPDLRITLRSALAVEKLRQRIRPTFTHIAAASDFGYAMIDALRIDRNATIAAYRDAHHDFPARVANEARFLASLRPDAVFANVAYLPLAGAAQAGIPALAMCSLNWAELFRHHFGSEAWAVAIHAEILAAYRSAPFLRTTPAMPLPTLDDCSEIGPIAIPGRHRRAELLEKVDADDTARLVIVALGGIPTRLPAENWPQQYDTHWLIPADWSVRRPDMHAIEAIDWPFVDLLRSVDAIVAKPGYGTFAEAVRNSTAVIYQRREDWPEQNCLIDWLKMHGRCAEVSATGLASGNLATAMNSCLEGNIPPMPAFDGAAAAARRLAALLS